MTPLTLLAWAGAICGTIIIAALAVAMVGGVVKSLKKKDQ